MAVQSYQYQYVIIHEQFYHLGAIIILQMISWISKSYYSMKDNIEIVCDSNQT